MKAKVQDVVIHRYIMLLLACFVLVREVEAQEFKEFYKSVSRNLTYPDELYKTCTITYTNLLLQVSTDGKIGNIQLSDNAPKLLKEKLLMVKHKFVLKELDALIKDKKLRSCGILVPLVYLLNIERCPHAFDDFEGVIKHYNDFSGTTYQGLTYNLKPLVVTRFDDQH